MELEQYKRIIDDSSVEIRQKVKEYMDELDREYESIPDIVHNTDPIAVNLQVFNVYSRDIIYFVKSFNKITKEAEIYKLGPKVTTVKTTLKNCDIRYNKYSSDATSFRHF